MTDGLYKDATVYSVAKWMSLEFRSNGQLNQKDAASEILRLFGERFVKETAKGGWSINKEVLDKFRRMNPDAKYAWWGWKHCDPTET